MSQLESEKEQSVLPPIIKDDEIDLIALLLHLWGGRFIIFRFIVGFIVIGLVVALASPVTYQSSVKLIPEKGRQSSMGALGGLASQFGFGQLMRGADGSSISPEHYPRIVQSLPFLQKVAYSEITSPEDPSKKVIVIDYFQRESKLSPFGLVKSYTVGLPRKILGLLSSDDSEQERHFYELREGIMEISEEELVVLQLLRELIGIELDPNDGMLRVFAVMPSPLMSSEVATLVAELLSSYIHNFKTEKVRDDLLFVEARHAEARQRFQAAQKQLALFRDANHGALTALARIEEQGLQSEYDLSFNIYNTLSTQLEEARIKVQEKTPVVSIIEPAVIPHKKNSPMRKRIMIIYTFIGFSLGLLFVFAKMALLNIRSFLINYLEYK